MAGHSKWKNTRHRKITQNVKKGKVINKFIREVKTATKLWGNDLVYNARLRTVLNKASSSNISKYTLNRAILSNCCSTESINYHKNDMEDVLYEGYGPEGTALMLQCLTNNRNRSVSEVRYALTKFGGNLGIQGSVSYLFNRQWVLICPNAVLFEDIIIDLALKVGADDVKIRTDGSIYIYLSLELISDMRLALKSVNLVEISSQIIVEPYKHVNLTQIGSLKMIHLINMLNSIDGVYKTYHNANF